MTDPAEEAFQRMLSGKRSGSYFTGNDARQAARETLGPIQDLYVRWSDNKKNLSEDAVRLLNQLEPLIFSKE